jgi:hypothetical protein
MGTGHNRLEFAGRVAVTWSSPSGARRPRACQPGRAPRVAATWISQRLVAMAWSLPARVWRPGTHPPGSGGLARQPGRAKGGRVRGEERASEGNGGRRRRTGSARWRWKPRRFSPTRYASFLGPSVRGSTPFLEEETVSRSSLTPSPHQKKDELSTKLMHIETHNKFPKGH